MNGVDDVTLAVNCDESSSGVELRQVDGRPGYYVGRDGSGWRRGRDGRLARVRINQRRDGCAQISVTRDGKKIGAIYIARAVLTAFVGPPPDGCVARHWPDPDPTNNRVENLRWAPPGSYAFQAAKFEAEANAEARAEVDACAGDSLPQSAPTRFVGPLADLLEDNRRRWLRLMKSQATVATYRAAQAKAGYRLTVRPGNRPSPWD